VSAMTIFMLWMLLLFPSISWAVTADVLINFESGSNGNAITTTNLAAGGTWSLDPSTSAACTISTDAESKFPGTITAGGTGYTDSESTRGFKFTCNIEYGYAEYGFSDTHSSVSVGFYFYGGIPAEDTTPYNVFNLGAPGQEACAPQWNDNTFGLETFAGGSSTISVDSNTWYWITLKYVQAGTGLLNIYNASTWALVGSASHSLLNYPASVVQIGQVHSEEGDAGSYYYIDDVMIDWTNATFPLLPNSSTSTVYTLTGSTTGKMQ
jgi:hypothetical protein